MKPPKINGPTVHRAYSTEGNEALSRAHFRLATLVAQAEEKLIIEALRRGDDVVYIWVVLNTGDEPSVKWEVKSSRERPEGVECRMFELWKFRGNKQP